MLFVGLYRIFLKYAEPELDHPDYRISGKFCPYLLLVDFEVGDSHQEILVPL